MSTPRRNDAQPTDAVPLFANRRVNTQQFHGPHFICNMEGLVLEVVDNKAVSSRFQGGRTQQWLLQPGPQGKVALASLNDGTYLGTFYGENYRARVGMPLRDRPTIQRTSFHWDLEVMNTQGMFSLSNAGEDKLALPLSPSTCELMPIVSTEEERKSTRLLILDNTPEVRAALQIGRIGAWAYPNRFVYHTVGEAGQIRIYNHLDSVVYAAVSDGGTSGSSGCCQYPVKPNNWQYWKRSSDEDVHVSLGSCIGAQTAEVFQGRVGKVLHIQSLPSRPVWEGMKSVLPTDARYTVNEVASAQYIGVKNNLQFSIYVLVLSSVQGGAESQYAMNPGMTSFWRRQDSEIVLVSVGGAPGAPRAFLGKLGSTLHIDRL